HPASTCAFFALAILSLLASVRPTDLLSFPTRRSSDLTNLGDLRGFTRTRLTRNDHNLVFTYRLRDLVTMTGDRQIFGIRDFGQGDRKSTRLNSSHVSISYAVFCLKKKNIIEQTSPTKK